MDMLPKLTPTEAPLLRSAACRADGRVIPPDTLRGGARVKALSGLLRRGWTEAGDGGYVLTEAGYVVAGRKRPTPPIDGDRANAVDDLQLLEGIPVSSGTKLAALVVALRRPQGATTLQLMRAIGWQPHTVRGAISAQMISFSCIHAGISRWPCNTRQTSMWSRRSTQKAR
ncbi:MAG: DUF3489 domain-containing protein [Sterolibacteriaceae bacterium]|nr:DUF3489 domain-containing protein [Sterolibacteriaceae bacterium]MBK9085686.1 DUF3489 domain-containing protein [Sterolibacteriaceae bacterium]